VKERKQQIALLLFLFLACGCAKCTEHNGNVDDASAEEEQVNSDGDGFEPDLDKDSGINQDSGDQGDYTANQKFTIPIEVVRERQGFGPLGQHGEKRISFLSNPTCSVDAHSNLVVYCDSNGKLFLINMETETEKEIGGTFFDNIVVACYPSIWNQVVAFQAIKGIPVNNTRLDIGVCNLQLMKCFWNEGSSDRKLPRLYGDTIVWQDYRFFNTSDPDYTKWRNVEIFSLNIENGEELRITDAQYQQMEPDIFGEYIVWRDNRFWEQTEVFLYNISTRNESNITNHSSHQWTPRVGERGTVWTDLRNGTGDILSHSNADIYYYDFRSGDTMQITSDTANQEHPKIYGKYIVWNDLRNGSQSPNGPPTGADVYLYDLDLKTEKRVTWAPENDGAARITGEKIIWSNHGSDGEALYMKSLNNL